MKKYFYIQLIMLSFLATLNNLKAQRALHFLHGFGGNASSWNVYKPHVAGLADSPLSTYSYTYTTNAGLNAGALDAHNQITPNKSSDPSRDIVLAHSFGGLVTREIERSYNADDFGGYITLATPHKGTGLANAYLSGQLENFFTEICQESIVEPISFVGPYGMFPVFNIVHYNSDLICNFLWNDVFLNKFADFVSTPSAIDLSINSPKQQQLNAFQSNKPRIAVGAKEESPTHWREICSIGLNKPSSLDLNTTKDETLKNIIDEIRYAEWAVSTVIESIPFFGNLFSDLAEECRQGYETLDKSEEKWNLMLGASFSSTYSVSSNEFQCQAQEDALGNQLESGEIGLIVYNQRMQELYCNPACWAIVTIQVPIQLGIENDGIVPLSSQLSLDGAAKFNTTKVNHQELLNHPNVTTILQNIFDSGNGGEFFVI
jgi:hypothetical protein